MKLADYKRAQEIQQQIKDAKENLDVLERRRNCNDYDIPFEMLCRHYEEIHTWLETQIGNLQAEFNAL